MKRNGMVLTAAVLCMLSLTACGEGAPDMENAPDREKTQAAETAQPQEKEQKEKTPEGMENAPEESTEAKRPEEIGSITVTFLEDSQEQKTEDGITLWREKAVYPEVKIEGNEKAAAAINEAVRPSGLLDFFPEKQTEEEFTEMVKEDYEFQGKENWRGYVMETEYAKKRTDDAVISFTAVSWYDMGGAHPNAVSTGINFDPATGNRYTLADVTKEEQKAVESILAFLLEETGKEEYESVLFEDYKENLKDILTEDTWYLSEDGFHVIGNEYIISPHAAGILDFVIPYAEADFLKERFLPVE